MPLYKVTKKGVNIDLALRNPATIDSFSALKNSFSSKVILHHFDFTKDRFVFTDASSVALSAILCQKDDHGQLRPVSFYSRTLSNAKRLWKIHDLELGAIIAALIEWRPWLIDSPNPVVFYTDHQNLKYFMNSTCLTPRQARWASYLSNFHLNIKHIKGSLNPADPLSRPFPKEKTPPTIPILQLITSPPDNSELDVPSDFLCPITSLLPSPPDNSDLYPPSEPLCPVSSIRKSPISQPISLANLHLNHFCPPDDHTMAALQGCVSEAIGETLSAKNVSIKDGMVWVKDKIYVPSSLRSLILNSYHGPPLSGHWGSQKTLDRILRTFFWPGMRADISHFIQSCLSCQKNRTSTQRKNPLLSTQLPDRPWSTVGIDFIVKLPVSNGFDSILVMVDHMTKNAHFIPACESWSAEDLAFCFIDCFVRHHGLPDKIISDRGATFVLKLWRDILDKLQVSPAYSTSFHPQTNGQTERFNQIIETYLRHFCNSRQDDWSLWTACAKISWSNSPSVSTGFSPFFLEKGYHPRLGSLTYASSVKKGDQFTTDLLHTQTTALDHIAKSKNTHALYYNQRAGELKEFEVGQFVWLSRKNITTRRASNKLDSKTIGPFEIIEKIGTHSVRLKLFPPWTKLHPVFNTNLLSPFHERPRSEGDH